MPRPILKNTFFLLLISILSVSASEYASVGGPDGDYSDQVGNSLFNSQLGDDYEFAVRNLNDPDKNPQVADLDNDGIKEIIVLTQGSLLAYNYSKETNLFQLQDSLVISSGDYFSNVELFDIDGDTRKEIIYVNRFLDIIYIVEFNSSDATPLGIKYSINLGNKPMFEPIVKCSSTDLCIYAWRNPNTVEKINLETFNHTHVIANDTVAATGATEELCFSNQAQIAMADWDSDDEIEFAVSYAYGFAAGPELYISVMEANSTHLTEETKFQINDFDYSSNDCNYLPYSFTSPVFADWSDEGGRYDIGIALNVDPTDDEFKAYLFVPDGNVIDDYPEIAITGAGYLISNPINMNGFEGSGKEICVMGYEDVSPLGNNRITLLCGSNRHFGIQHRLYTIDGNFSYNIASDRYVNFQLAHAIESQTETGDTSSSDLEEELINSYGVYRLANEVCSLTGNCVLEKIWANGVSESMAVIPYDHDDDGYNDLLGMTNGTLYFFNDLRVNSAPFFTSLKIQPDILQPIKTNSSMNIVVEAEDYDTPDTLSIRAMLYYGNPNNQTIGWLNFTSNTISASFFFGGALNRTGSGHILMLQLRDSYRPDRIVELSKTFSVSDQGVVEFGDGSKFIEGYIAPGQEEEEEEDVVSKADADAMKEVIAPSGLIAEEFEFAWGVLVLIIASVAILFGLKQWGFLSNQELMVPWAVLTIICWLALILIKIIPGWTLLVTLFICAAIFGFRFWQSRGGVNLFG